VILITSAPRPTRSATAFVDLDGARFHYRLDGPAEAPVLLLSNSLGTDLGMWSAQLPAWSRRFRVLRYDTRGHGRSAVTPGPYTIDQLGGDALALLDALALPRVHCCGLSLGGMTGMWLATHAPARIDRLVLSNTAAQIAPPELWNARIDAVDRGGMTAIVDAVLARWFTAPFLAAGGAALAAMRAMLLACPAQGYIAACAASRRGDPARFAVLPAEARADPAVSTRRRRSRRRPEG
jgi:3-oxoadipate enol-lactonase